MIHIISIKFEKSLEIIDKILDDHRKFLKTGYQQNLFIASGPKTPRTGGVIIAKGDLNEIKKFLEKDPYNINDAATYSYESFNAVLHNDDFKHCL